LTDLGGVLLRPEMYVDNVFDHKYLLKGAFFSGASVGRPRSVQLRLNVGL
jgi:outer membrane receptor for Fe3+-dicitrate